MRIQKKPFEFLETGAPLLVPINVEALDSREKDLLTSELKLIEYIPFEPSYSAYPR